MVNCHSAQPAQHVRCMRPEDAAVAMALIDDHVLQPPEKAVPPGMARQQHVVQHVGRGEQVAEPQPDQPRGSRAPVLTGCSSGTSGVTAGIAFQRVIGRQGASKRDLV